MYTCFEKSLNTLRTLIIGTVVFDAKGMTRSDVVQYTRELPPKLQSLILIVIHMECTVPF